MRTLYNGGRIHASAGAVAWFKKMGAGWDPDKLDGVAMVAEQIAAKREFDPMFSDLPLTILTRDVIEAFRQRIENDEQQEAYDAEKEAEVNRFSVRRARDKNGWVLIDSQFDAEIEWWSFQPTEKDVEEATAGYLALHDSIAKKDATHIGW